MREIAHESEEFSRGIYFECTSSPQFVLSHDAQAGSLKKSLRTSIDGPNLKTHIQYNSIYYIASGESPTNRVSCFSVVEWMMPRRARVFRSVACSQFSRCWFELIQFTPSHQNRVTLNTSCIESLAPGVFAGFTTTLRGGSFVPPCFLTRNQLG